MLLLRKTVDIVADVSRRTLIADAPVGEDEMSMSCVWRGDEKASSGVNALLWSGVLVLGRVRLR